MGVALRQSPHAHLVKDARLTHFTGEGTGAWRGTFPSPTRLGNVFRNLNPTSNKGLLSLLVMGTVHKDTKKPWLSPVTCPPFNPLAELAATAVGVKGAVMSQVPLLENVLSV